MLNSFSCAYLPPVYPLQENVSLCLSPFSSWTVFESWVLRVPYTFCIQCLCQICDLQLSAACLFILSAGSFAEQKIFIWMRSTFSFFTFVDHALDIKSKNSSPNTRSQDFLLSPQKFYYFTYYIWIHDPCGINFCIQCRLRDPCFLTGVWFFQPYLLKGYSISIELLLRLWSQTVGHTHMGVLLTLYTACVVAEHICTHLWSPPAWQWISSTFLLGSPTTPHIRGLGNAPRLVRLQASTGKGCVEPPWPLMAPGTTRGPQGGVGSNTEAETPRPKPGLSKPDCLWFQVSGPSGSTWWIPAGKRWRYNPYKPRPRNSGPSWFLLWFWKTQRIVPLVTRSTWEGREHTPRALAHAPGFGPQGWLTCTQGPIELSSKKTG